MAGENNTGKKANLSFRNLRYSEVTTMATTGSIYHVNGYYLTQVMNHNLW